MAMTLTGSVDTYWILTVPHVSVLTVARGRLVLEQLCMCEKISTRRRILFESDTPLQIVIISTCLCGATCNQAEYSALILGLEAACDAGLRIMQVRGDSNLVVKQVYIEIIKNLWPTL
ncbi:TPA: Ribonuclease HI [Trebouxia sp. C0004]